ncbi:MMPL family transporter [Kineococcus sp. R8]|uniref:MMPL family transporter n=1 Tax=Kineococcus siccus TaxID=2696567 RepID=UPI0014122BDE|nr:MMPL family transporter [Kineococcus siccus]NAZ80431.1 MMPL family transporter [Kineococcus siccus]
MARLATFVLRHRLLVVLLWVGVAVAGGLTAARTVDRLSYEFGLPGAAAYETNTRIQAEFGGGGLVDPVVVTAGGPAGTYADAAAVRDFTASVQRVAGAAPGTRVVSPADAPALVSPDGRRAVALLYPRVVPGPDPYAAALPALQAAADGVRAVGSPLQLTGTVLLTQDGGGGDRGVLAEVVLGGAGALVVLVLVFTSLLAAVPLVVAAVSILATFLALLGLTAVTDVSFVVQYLIALIGLGVAIDYSLLIVMRWREERAAGADNDTAVRTALATAGRSVLFSGVTVAVSLAALIAVPLPFLRSIGLGGMLIPLLSVATSLTLVPVLLHVAGPRLQWPRRSFRDPTSRRWASIARFTVRRKWPVVVVTSLFLLALAAPLLTLRLGSPSIDAYGTSSPPARAAADVVAAGIAPGVLRPTEVLVPRGSLPGVADALAAVPGVAAATDPGWTAGGSSLLQVWTAADPASDAGSAALEDVRATAAAAGAQVGGTPAEDADFVSAVYGDAPLVLIVIVVVTFVLLARSLRSVWLPVKALVLNVLSIGAAYGLTIVVWQCGIGTELLFDVRAAGSITTWVPVAVFAFLFGLSMDYEVFILSRMREAYDEHGDTPRAVVEGIARTGRLVTSAALILFLAFIALSTVPSTEVKILATALALGILIDAVVVRGLLAPALVAVLGRANWVLPAPVARLLLVRDEQPSRSGSGDPQTSGAGRVAD